MAKIEENIVQNSIPDGLKEKGLAVLGTVVTNQAMIFANQMIPSLEKQLVKMGRECPSPGELTNIINVRNNILGQANSISGILNKITATVALTALGISTLIGLIKALKIAKTGLSVASKLIPIGLPGAIPAAISDVDDLITNKTFDIEGSPKIAPVKSSIDGVSVPLALISFYIITFVRILNLLDAAIKECQPNLSLPSLSDELLEISKVQIQAEESPNLSTYNGFVLEIEVVPYSPTVDRRRAVGKNQSGIVMIQTELSFTPIDQVMINELKFIIDKDNLRAN